MGLWSGGAALVGDLVGVLGGVLVGVLLGVVYGVSCVIVFDVSVLLGHLACVSTGPAQRSANNPKKLA